MPNESRRERYRRQTGTEHISSQKTELKLNMESQNEEEAGNNSNNVNFGLHIL